MNATHSPYVSDSVPYIFFLRRLNTCIAHEMVRPAARTFSPEKKKTIFESRCLSPPHDRKPQKMLIGMHPENDLEKNETATDGPYIIPGMKYDRFARRRSNGLRR